jgi:hypothetical protein
MAYVWILVFRDECLKRRNKEETNMSFRGNQGYMSMMGMIGKCFIEYNNLIVYLILVMSVMLN